MSSDCSDIPLAGFPCCLLLMIKGVPIFSQCLSLILLVLLVAITGGCSTKFSSIADISSVEPATTSFFF